MKNGQIWYIDFILGLLVFTVALLISLRYATNTYMLFSGDDAPVRAAQYISESLMGKGAPAGWNYKSAARIGLTDGDHVLSREKVQQFSLASRDYERSKSLLNTRYDYFVYFTDRNNSIINIGGVCGTGSPYFFSGYNASTARIGYYYYDENFMEAGMLALGADVYNRAGTAPAGGIQEFLTNISHYRAVILENPNLDDVLPSTPGEVKDALEEYVNGGGTIFLDGEVKADLLNALFVERTDTGKTAAIETEDVLFNMTEGAILVFNAAHYMNSTSASSDYTVIARYTDNLPAIARWEYGYGQVYYFSDLDNIIGTDILEYLKNAAAAAAARTCEDVEVSAEYRELSSVPRYVVYRENSSAEIIKMVIYVWE